MHEPWAAPRAFLAQLVPARPSRWLAGAVLLLLPAGPAGAAGSGTVLEMKLEATFLRLDVAQVALHLPGLDPAALDSTRRAGGAAALARRAMAADSVAIRMEFLRGVGTGRLVDSIRGNLEAARDAGWLSASELDSIWPGLEQNYRRLGSRGVREGDVLWHRVASSGAQSELRSARGRRLWVIHREGAVYRRGLLASFLAPGTDFREGLVGGG